MNPDAYKQPEAKPKAWNCPCSGCGKAVKQERSRISEAIELIDINSSSQINALGMKLLILEIINPPKK
jgi:hypothetical protein